MCKASNRLSRPVLTADRLTALIPPLAFNAAYGTLLTEVATLTATR